MSDERLKQLIEQAGMQNSASLYGALQQAENEGFQAGAASRDAEIARLKTVPMKYRRMEFNAQLQDEVAKLEKENDQLREQIKALRDASSELLVKTGINGLYAEKLIKALAATEPNERMTKMEVTEFTDEDAADVGRALIKAIEMHAYPGWGPAECPSEIVGDLRNECDELKAKLDGAAKVVLALVQVARAAWNAADNGLGVLAEDGIELRVSPVDFDAISDALGLLDMLPDDKPGFTLNGPARAEWALRNLLCSQD